MAKLGSIDLEANKDVKKGEGISINALFTWSERKKEFELLEDVTSDTTGIKVTIAKVESFDSKADTSRKKGEKSSCWGLLKPADASKNLKASDDIKKGDKLSLTIESL